jgi:hypothetical protein
MLGKRIEINGARIDGDRTGVPDEALNLRE